MRSGAHRSPPAGAARAGGESGGRWRQRACSQCSEAATACSHPRIRSRQRAGHTLGWEHTRGESPSAVNRVSGAHRHSTRTVVQSRVMSTVWGIDGECSASQNNQLAKQNYPCSFGESSNYSSAAENKACVYKQPKIQPTVTKASGQQTASASRHNGPGRPWSSACQQPRGLSKRPATTVSFYQFGSSTTHECLLQPRGE